MARVALAVQTSSRSGLDPTFSAATVDGEAFDNANQDVVLYVKNASASPIDVTVATPALVDGLAIADRVVAVPASGERVIGPFPKGVYNQVSTTPAIAEAVYVNTSAQASVTLAALKLGAL